MVKKNDKSDLTIKSYVGTIQRFQKQYKSFTKNTLLVYRQYLIDNYKPSTANQRIHAINRYLEFSHRKSLCLKCVKVQNKPFLENVISNNDYLYFCKKLKEEHEMKVYFMVKFIACTGARPCELVKFRVDHVETGWMDVYSKGGKMRRIYIPKKLCNEAKQWLKSENIESGTIFKNKNGETITTRGISKLLKKHASKYKSIPLQNVYPYSFRHLFAKNFLKAGGEPHFLCDLMGHSSFQTTLIYLRKSSVEQYRIVNRIVVWL